MLMMNFKAVIIRQRLQEMNDRITRQNFNYDADLEKLQEYLQEAQTIGDRPLEAETLKLLGTLHAMARHYTPAIDYYNRSATIYLEADDMNGYVAVRSNIGVVHEMNYRRAEAITIYQETLTKIDLDNVEPAYISSVLTLLANLGIALQRSMRHDEAEPHYLRMIDFLSHKNIIHVEQRRVGEATAIARSGLANIYRLRGQYEAGWIQARLGYEIAEKIQIPLRILYGLSVMVHLALDDPNAPYPPTHYWQKLDEYVNGIKNKATLLFLAQIYLEEARTYPDEWARRYGEKSLQIYKDCEDEEGIRRANAFLTQES